MQNALNVFLVFLPCCSHTVSTCSACSWFDWDVIKKISWGSFFNISVKTEKWNNPMKIFKNKLCTLVKTLFQGVDEIWRVWAVPVNQGFEWLMISYYLRWILRDTECGGSVSSSGLWLKHDWFTVYSNSAWFMSVQTHTCMHMKSYECHLPNKKKEDFLKTVRTGRNKSGKKNKETAKM